MNKIIKYVLYNKICKIKRLELKRKVAVQCKWGSAPPVYFAVRTCCRSGINLTYDNLNLQCHATNTEERLMLFCHDLGFRHFNLIMLFCRLTTVYYF